MPFIVHKKVGETPLEALERFRAEKAEFASLPMTYAGRLDPMAEGELLILVGEECKRKSEFLGLDKEYVVEAVFGFETDTYDLLGMPKAGSAPRGASFAPDFFRQMLDLSQKKPRTFIQKYPPYSSRTVGGVPLHELARSGQLPDENDLPEKEVTIYSIEELSRGELSPEILFERINGAISKLPEKADFRQKEILEKWGAVLKGRAAYPFVKVKVRCSSGTYMRSLAHRMGQDAGTGAFALSIVRTKIEVK